MAARGARITIRPQRSARPSLTSRLRRKLGLAYGDEAALIKELRSFLPDLVIFSQGGSYDLVLYPQVTGWLQARRIRYRVIANWQQEHPQLETSQLHLIRDTFVTADHIYFVSTRNLAVTRRHLATPLPHASLIQNPLRWQSADVAPWPQGPVARLATVSRLDEGKGIQVLLQALAAAPALPAWQLNIFGSGPQEPHLRQAVAELGLQGHVCFRGYVSGLRAIWAENQLMISPSLEDGVPMTIPEAMLCQRPVLATRVGGAEDWIIPQRTGFLCPQSTTGDMRKSLQQALDAREDWEDMGRAAAESAFGRYRPDDYLQLIAES